MDFGVTAAIKQQRQLCQILVRAYLVAAGGGGVYMPLQWWQLEAVGNGKEGQVDGFVGVVQGQINGRHWDDHWWDIVIVCLYCFPNFPSPPWVVESAANQLCSYKYWGGSAHNYHQPWLKVLKGQVHWGIMEQSRFWGVNKKLTWTKMRMGVLNALLVFGAMMSALKQECQAKV